MESKPIIIPEELHLLQIEEQKSYIDDKFLEDETNKQLSIGHSIMHNLEDERIKLSLTFSFQNENKKEILNFGFDYHFHIERLFQFYKYNEHQKPIFDGLLIATLLGICLSTSRGLIYEKCKTRGLKNIIIPIVSPQKMLSK